MLRGVPPAKLSDRVAFSPKVMVSRLSPAVKPAGHAVETKHNPLMVEKARIRSMGWRYVVPRPPGDRSAAFRLQRRSELLEVGRDRWATSVLALLRPEGRARAPERALEQQGESP